MMSLVPPLSPSDLPARWAQWHADIPPIGFLLRDAYPERWLRIYSLPEGKRYATSASERAEIRRRHITAALDVLGDGGERGTIIVGMCERMTDLGRTIGVASNTFGHGWQLPSWLWDEQRGYYAVPMCAVGADTMLPPAQFNRFLDEIAEDRCRGLVFNLDSSEVYAPYDGGADLFYATELARDLARKRLADWVSDREDGL